MKTLQQALGDGRLSLLLDAVAGDVPTELSSWLVDGGTLVSYGGMSGDRPDRPRRQGARRLVMAMPCQYSQHRGTTEQRSTR